MKTYVIDTHQNLCLVSRCSRRIKSNISTDMNLHRVQTDGWQHRSQYHIVTETWSYTWRY